MDLYKFHSKPDKLHGHHEANDMVPARIKPLVLKNKSLVKINEKQKKSIARDAELSYLYALQQKKRFPEGEPAISKDAGWSLFYAQDVIKGAWPEGEDTIATDAEYSIDYATYVIKKRFPKCEPNLLKNQNAYQLINYARDVIKGPWPEAEPLILKSKNISYLYDYAEMTGKRFKPAEKYIAKDSHFAWHYANNVVKGPWPEGEDAIAKDGRNSFWYSELINKRFRKGEKIIKGSYYQEHYERKWKIEL
jgi:hypothetical protein